MVADKNIPILVQNDPWLAPYQKQISDRIKKFDERYAEIVQQFGSLRDYAGAHHELGLNYDAGQKGWWYREWAPAATSLGLVGDFNDWDDNAHQLKRNEAGYWELFIPEAQLSSGQKFKVRVASATGTQDRIPA